jgi:hypothetical protein
VPPPVTLAPCPWVDVQSTAAPHLARTRTCAPAVCPCCSSLSRSTLVQSIAKCIYSPLLHSPYVTWPLATNFFHKICCYIMCMYTVHRSMVVHPSKPRTFAPLENMDDKLDRGLRKLCNQWRRQE